MCPWFAMFEGKMVLRAKITVRPDWAQPGRAAGQRRRARDFAGKILESSIFHAYLPIYE